MKNKLLAAIIICLFTFNIGKSQMQTLNKELPCVNKTFKVYAHVILDTLGVANYTAAMLEQSLMETNQVFANICVQFELCGIDTITNYEFDVIENSEESDEITTLYHHKNRINFYLASFLLAPPVCGFASLGGVANPTNGIVFLKCPGSGTLIHELGHLFGLAHTFGGAELVDGSNCETEADGICDTPADPYYADPEITWEKDCEFVWEEKDSNGEFYQPDIGNYMSYYSCPCGFSRQQYLKMANTYLNSNRKMW
ncbi:MAG: M43 family zinc metalloprotease [Saprospiraceae bacterium]